MDTYFCIDSDKCQKCYECVKLCAKLHKNTRGCLGFLEIDTYDGVPDNILDNPICHICESDKVKYPCTYICEHNAIKITRW